MSRFARFARAASASRPLARVAALGLGLGVVAAGPASCSGSWASWLGFAPAGTPNYDDVAQSIADLLESNPDYDDGSYGPLFVRLAWHAAGTYSVRGPHRAPAAGPVFAPKLPAAAPPTPFPFPFPPPRRRLKRMAAATAV